MNVRLLLSTLLIFTVEFNGQVRCKFMISSLEPCDSGADYPIKMNITFRNVGGLQYMEEKAYYKIPLDNTLEINCTVEKYTGRKKYVHLFAIHEKKACDTMHKLLGEFLYEVERNAGLVPGLCPIPQGRHQVHNMPLHFEKMAMLQTIPFDQMRSTIVMVDPKNNIVNCFVAVVENRL